MGGAVVGGTSMVNCILWGDNGGTQYPEYEGPTATYCDIAGGIVSGTGNISSDPLYINAFHGNLRLASNSPCIDAGSNAAVSVSTDLDGNSRILNNTVDMGAYELVPMLTVKSGSFIYNATRPTVEMVFSGPLLAGSSISPGSLILTNTTTGETIDTTFQTEAIYNPGIYTADWLYDNVLPDGNYTAEIKAGSVKDASGNPLSADFSFDFFVLGGDANHDGVVNVTDLFALATNWKTSGKTFSQGDFNYDGEVDLNDLQVLAGNWGKTASGFSMAPLLGPMPTILPLSSPPALATSMPQGLTPGAGQTTSLAATPSSSITSTVPSQSLAATAAPAVAAPKKPVVLHKSTISGSVFNDRNRDKKRGGKDQGLSGWRVFIDANHDGILDAGETSVLTDKHGDWTFKGLSVGTYTVRVASKPGWVGTTSKNEALTLKLKTSQHVAGKLFGQTHPS
jgi:hypothetical protein